MKMPIKLTMFDNGYQALSDHGFSLHQEVKIYDDNLQDIIDNPRWYLDNLENLRVYTVRWHSYTKRGVKETPTVPYKYTENRNLYISTHNDNTAKE